MINGDRIVIYLLSLWASQVPLGLFEAISKSEFFCHVGIEVEPIEFKSHPFSTWVVLTCNYIIRVYMLVISTLREDQLYQIYIYMSESFKVDLRSMYVLLQYLCLQF